MPRSSLLFAVCVPYYSIPEFPLGCRIIRRQEILTRDVLLCNPSNFHPIGGAQFDPHLETLEYMNCQPPVRRSICRKIQQYEDLLILFRTRAYRLDGTSPVLVTGYYVVASTTDKICREAPVIKASRARFVSAADAIDITSLMEREKARRSCFTTENPKWEPHLLSWIQQINNQRDATTDYTSEIQRLKRIYRNNEFRFGNRYRACGSCPDEDQCLLVRRRKRLGCLQKVPAHFQ